MSIALYDGCVVHRRLRPVRHRLRYRLPWFLIDLQDRTAMRFFSFDRFNLFSFHDRDHGIAGGGALDAQLRGLVAAAGETREIVRIQALCMPRVLGFVFNPLTVYFGCDAGGTLRAVIYEVNNTFHQRHCYVLLAEDSRNAAIAQHCQKQFHVSPFMDMDLTYHFRVRVPDERAMVAVSVADGGGRMFDAVFAGRRRELTAWTLLRLGMRFPLLAAQVLGAIHWEALILWLKGMTIRKLPPMPSERATFG